LLLNISAKGKKKVQGSKAAGTNAPFGEKFRERGSQIGSVMGAKAPLIKLLLFL
jgi:hypothetical protein